MVCFREVRGDVGGSIVLDVEMGNGEVGGE